MSQVYPLKNPLASTMLFSLPSTTACKIPIPGGEKKKERVCERSKEKVGYREGGGDERMVKWREGVRGEGV